MMFILAAILAVCLVLFAADAIKGHAQTESKRDDLERFLQLARQEGIAQFLDGLEKYARGTFDPYAWFDRIQAMFSDPVRKKNAFFDVVAAQLPGIVQSDDLRLRLAALLQPLGFRLVRIPTQTVEAQPSELREVKTEGPPPAEIRIAKTETVNP
jgi:hypothetical protein